ncbi:MAG: cytochrome c nitrite reductase small subunit [Bacteroidales bacterium]|nr:cytochrome c nitrite reductase small subunit [Bacteroidales bacterium]
MKIFLKSMIPPGRWQLPVAVLMGIFVGTGLLILRASNAHSYLSDDPKTCINCHVMYTQYASWTHSSHREVATCNDCHVPHDNVVRKYMFKAMDGMRHASIFTARAEPQVIQIRRAGANVVQENCIRCHRELVDMVMAIRVTADNHNEGAGARCWDCHRETPHGSVNSLSAAPYTIIPRMESVMPAWMEKSLKENN